MTKVAWRRHYWRHGYAAPYVYPPAYGYYSPAYPYAYYPPARGFYVPVLLSLPNTKIIPPPGANIRLPMANTQTVHLPAATNRQRQ